ncbi:hypothetical protein [Rhodococcus sp. HNM0569]|uniref:hypothetical protein n=1 Tax=Rhodococcus sp. HNM0569 TaxID=2716340 RepID=UPI00146CABEA|nr:hypothetical protein [Rhodococcus sp. HNM0569]NLU82186.1 hypothetical protein [Rhodococcus sp. HNM0569]
MPVFGEPYEVGDGTVIVTVTRTDWRGRDHPLGLYVVGAQGATWKPAVDASLHGVIGVLTGFVAAALGTLAVLRRPPWPELTERVMRKD